MAALASKAGLATNTVRAVQAGADSRRSTLESLAGVMAEAGILFLPDGTVVERMTWPNGKPSDPRVAEAAIAILNADRKRDGK